MKVVVLALIIALGGCDAIKKFVPDSIEEKYSSGVTKVVNAVQYIDYSERSHRAELREFTGVDPVSTEWCAAFVNAVLNESGIKGSESVSDNPLLARSFLKWGIKVDEPLPGDLVVFPRGSAGWQGHVGFYISTVEINGVKFYQILGGNQNNKVSIELYPAKSALGIRRSGV